MKKQIDYTLLLLALLLAFAVLANLPMCYKSLPEENTASMEIINPCLTLIQ